MNQRRGEEAPSWLERRYRRKYGFVVAVFATLGVMDVAFKCLVVPAFVDVNGGGAPLLETCVETIAVVMTAWVAAVIMLAWPLQHWLHVQATSEQSNDAIRMIVRTVHKWPQRMALLWSLQWVLIFGVVIARSGRGPTFSDSFFLGAMTLGPLPIAHSIAAWLSAPLVGELSLAARRRGIGVAGTPISIGTRLALYSLCISLAPTFYMTALTFSMASGTVTRAHLLVVVGVFYGGIALFAILCAIFLATTITDPVGRMARVMKQITAQGDVSRVGRVPLFQRDEVGTLADLTNTMIDRLEVTAAERSLATASLASLNRTLESRVEERTCELSSKNAEMRLVLDNVTQGLFISDREGLISSECSTALLNWFGPATAGQRFFDYLGRGAGSFAATTQLAWQQVVDDILPFDVAAEQLPKRLSRDSKHYRLSYEPIRSGESGRFLIVVSDVTRELDHASVQQEKRELLALFERMLADRSGFVAFFDEASAMVSLVLAPGPASLIEVKRSLHTLKGNAAIFGVESIAEICHALESRIDDEHALPQPAHLEQLKYRWSRLVAEVDRLLGQRRRVIEVSPERHAELESALRNGTPREALVSMVHELRLEPVERRLHHFAEQATQIGRRLGKEIAARVEHDEVRLDGRHWAKFWGAFVHAVRNAVDHGIEPPEHRRSAGKPETGTVTLRARRDVSKVIIEVEDDGQGVELAKLQTHAAAHKGALSEQELLALLFVDGVSTASEVTSLSGRGVGLGALRSAVHELGGAIAVHTQRGRGMRLTMTFPEASIAPDRQVRSLG
ncbi:MAG TPA: ATP-binding protein [Polyangiaceae bacterium]|nr:ATP-binding protein [Polyangiaceae bacterium]